MSPNQGGDSDDERGEEEGGSRRCGGGCGRRVRHGTCGVALLHGRAPLRLGPRRLAQPRLATVAQPALAVPVAALVGSIVGLVRLCTRLWYARVWNYNVYAKNY